MNEITLLPLKTSTYKFSEDGTIANWTCDDGLARQGNYNGMEYLGCSFFGSDFESIRFEDVRYILITIKRVHGGLAKPIDINICTHIHPTQPDGRPIFIDRIASMELDINSEGVCVINDTSSIAMIQMADGIGVMANEPNNIEEYGRCLICKMEFIYK